MSKIGERENLHCKQEDLQYKIDYLEEIISLMPGHVYWKDRNGVLLGCNNEQARDIGLRSREEIKGLTAYDTLPKELADVVTEADKEVIENGISITVEEVLILPNGQETIWLSKKVPLRNRGGNIVGLLGISFDITEQKRIEQELHETRHKLEGMTLVSASIAHELRTPLAALDMGINSLKNYLPKLLDAYKLALTAGLPVQQIRKIHMQLLEGSLATMGVETKAAFTFIEMLLMNINPSLEQIDANPFSIVSCVQETLMRYPFSESQKALVHHDVSQDFMILGKELLLVHILFNLLKNALYYIAKAAKGEIYIWQRINQGVNKLYFKDTGAGIVKSDLVRIFDRFFSKTHHGAGIGLTYCKMAMESMGGEITCESEEGNYTLFILTFPPYQEMHELEEV